MTSVEAEPSSLITLSDPPFYDGGGNSCPMDGMP